MFYREMGTRSAESISGTPELKLMLCTRWKAFVRDKYHTEPSLTYLDSLVVVDNVTHDITSDA